MVYWAQTPQGRDQLVLFAPTLDDMIGATHPVQLLDEILAVCDWSKWEAEYNGRRGQPPIHPRVLASVLLYWLTRGLRSSRQLEYVCANNIDFLWLVEGRSIDHSTFCDFRTKFRLPLKTLFRQVCKIAMTMGLIRLGEVTLDATRVKANNGRYETLTAAKLEEKLRALDEQLEKMLHEAEQADAAQQMLFGLESPSNVPAEQWDKLPRNPQTKHLDKSCFVYDELRDVYYCPQGQPLSYEKVSSDVRSGVRVKFRVYRCAACAGCPLAAACLKDTAKNGRQVTRDVNEGEREALAAKMATEASQATYARRFHAGEVPFAVIKRIMGLRQFLLRGLERVRTEWLWTCTAFNLMKLLREIARLRADFAQLQETGV